MLVELESGELDYIRILIIVDRTKGVNSIASGVEQEDGFVGTDSLLEKINLMVNQRRSLNVEIA